MNITVTISGLSKVISRFNNSPAIIDKELELAFRKSLALMERNVKLRTPVDTGRLRASIGSESQGGWRYIKKTVAGLGTKVWYAYWVEVRKARHMVGEWGYFSKGVQASISGISNFFKQAMENVAKRITQ